MTGTSHSQGNAPSGTVQMILHAGEPTIFVPGIAVFSYKHRVANIRLTETVR